MKKITILLALSALLMVSCKSNNDGVMTYKDGVFTVNTTQLGKDIEGYNGATPLLITIENKLITNIEVLENEETPRFLQRATDGLFPAMIGREPDAVLVDDFDAVAGATYSSDAILANLRLGLKYWCDHWGAMYMKNR